MDYKVFPFVKEDLQENGSIKGYGSTFGGKPDSYKDVIQQGSFLAALAKNGRGGMGFPMLWMHDSHDPAGVWEKLNENGKGLYVEGPIENQSQEGLRKYNLAKMGAVKGLSIGFDLDRDKNGRVDTKVYDYDEKTGVRLLKKINLWEVSLVTFAANTRASITGVKGLQEAKTVRELERILRDSGLPKSEAVYLASLCKTGLRDSGAESQVEDLLKTVKKTNEEMKTHNLLAGLLNDLNFINSELKI